MLGNCILRNPMTFGGAFDKGALCETLLFFSKSHLLIDMATLGNVINCGFEDDLIAFLESGFLTANYSPQMAVLYNDGSNGLREHFCTVVKFGGVGRKSNMRNPELMEQQLGRLIADRGKARSVFRRLCKNISFKDLEDHNVKELGCRDLCERAVAERIASLSLRNQGVPDNEIRFTKIDIMPLGDGKFAISSDIDFEYLRQFLPEAERGVFSQDHLFPAVSDARFDIGLAAAHNAAFVGNERNREITELIMKRSLGGQFDSSRTSREIYDFISVALPSVHEILNSGERTPAEFLTLLEKSKSFRAWINNQNPTADLVNEMLKEKSKTSWLESLPIKGARFGLFTGAGAIADMFAPGVGVALGAIDNFLVEKINRGWRPHYFVEHDLKGFLDK